MLAQLLGTWPFAANGAFAATKPRVLPAHLTYQQFEQLARQSAQHRQPFHWFVPTTPTPRTPQELAFMKTKHTLLPTAEPPTMQPIRQTLSPTFLAAATGTPSLDLLSSDHRLQIVIPAGAFDLSHAVVTGSATHAHHPRPRPTPTPAATPVPSPTAAATGTPSATPTPAVAPTATATPRAPPTVTPTPSPSPAPGSVSGPLTLVITEQHGLFVGQQNQLAAYQMQMLTAQGQLVTGITLRHPLTISYHYQPGEMLGLDLDPSQIHLSWPTLALAARTAHQPTTPDVLLMHNDATTQTLSAQSSVLDNGPFVVSGDPQNQSPPSPNVASVGGNTGQIAYSYPLQVAPAPGGFVPQLTLSYSSGTTNERQSVTSPAGDVGEGWSLSLGAITAQVYPSNSAGGAATWYSISGVDGISDRLVPDPNHSGWYFTQHLSYLRIQQATSNGEPCFHVWDKAGTTYNFGCTADSLQYRNDSSGLHLYQWDLDEMNAANDGDSSTIKQINVTYFQDCGSDTGSCPQASQSNSDDTIRDAAIAQIQYGTGLWEKPLTIAGTVDFEYWAPTGDSPWAIPYTQPYNGQSYGCGNNSTMRCDDPQTDDGTNPPAVMSTLTLLSVTSYVGPDSGSGSSPAYQYQFKYQDSSTWGCTDPLTQADEDCAGEHLLTKVTPTVYQANGPHQLQPLHFDYTGWGNKQDTYEDEGQQVGGHIYNLATNWQYLADYYDTTTGVGEHIDYETAYNNSNGTPYDKNTGDNRLDPTFCFTHTTCTGSFAYPDNRAWSTQVVADTKSFSIDSSAMSEAQTSYAYVLSITNTSPGACPKDSQGVTYCVGDNWIPPSDSDWQDFTHGQFQGFNSVSITSPSNDLTVDDYFSTDGWNSNSANPNNAFAGDLNHQDVYQGPSASGTHLLGTVSEYAGLNNSGTVLACVSMTTPYDPCEAIVYSSTTTAYEGSSASNPPSVTTASYYDDYNPPGAKQANWQLSMSGNYHNLLEETITGSNTPDNPNPTITEQWSYSVTDSGYGSPSWYFYDVNKVAHSEVDDSSGRQWECQNTTYDEGSGSNTPEAGWPTTVSTYPSGSCTSGTPITTSYAGYDVYGNLIATVDPVAAANASFYGSTGITGKNGCTPTGTISIMSANWSKSRYTTCIVYNGTYNHALPTSMTNAFNQSVTMQYDPQQNDLPIVTTDANSQQTTYAYSYDSSGNRTVQVTEPNETTYSYTTQSVTNSTCSSSIPSGATTPCFEVDTNSALYPTAISRTFYDGLGRAVETNTPGPTSGDDTIQFTVYNDANHTSFTSVPFEVAATTSWIDPATATDKNGHTPAGTVTYYDAASRVIAVDDPLFNPPSVPGIYCPSLSANATACTVYKLDSPQGVPALYDTTKAIDPNNHATETFTDALGRTAYTQDYSGLSGNGLTPNEQVSYLYDVLDQPTSITTTDLSPQSGETTTSVTNSMTYDDLGRLLTLSDPDRGTHSYSYDPDGNLLTDTSGTRVLGYNDDLLGRVGCVQVGAATLDADGSCTSGTQPLVQNTYDTTEIGTQGVNDFPIGRLTQSVSTTAYPEGGSVSSTEQFQYDARGRVTTEQLALATPTSWNLSLPTYQLTQSYTDADQPETTQTSTIAGQQKTPQDTFSQVYDGTLGVLTGLGSTTSTTNANLASLSYNVNALISQINTQTSTNGNLASESFSYDGDLRPTEESTTWQSGSGQSGTFFDEARGYDPASNVSTVTTTMSQPNGQSGSYTETQNFCYDEQDRLVWAGNSGTQPSPGNGTCGSGTLANTFPGGSYATAFSSTHLGQLWQGPVNGTGSSEQYLYCTSSAPHQLTGLYASGSTCSSKSGKVYTSSYDAWGNVISRTYNNQTATLSYNQLDQMVEWQIPSTNQAWYAYDSGGNRTLEHSTQGSTTSTTVYAFGLEEYTYDSGGNLLSSTHYYSLAGQLLAEEQISGSTSTTNFFLTDALGSVLGVYSNTAGSAAFLSNQVYSPYGTQVSHNGNAMSQYTSKGFTGQYNDPTSGLDYYVSRYYDPISGVFLSADAVQGNLAGLNPYGYAGGNPETYNDPTGQAFIPPGGGGGGSSGGGNTGGNTGSNGYGGGSGGSTGSSGYSGPYYDPQSGPPQNQPACSYQTVICKTGVNLNVTNTSTVTIAPRTDVLASSCAGSLGGFSSFGGAGISVCIPSFIGGRSITFQQQATGTICIPTILCMDESGGEEAPPEDASTLISDNLFASDETGMTNGALGGDRWEADGGDGNLAQTREELGMPARSVEPDDNQTLSILYADGKDYWGINGGGGKNIQLKGLSSGGIDHAEIDALNQLYLDRIGSQASGGTASMWVDRPPCWAFCLTKYGNGDIVKAVDQAGLDALEINYGAGIDQGEYRPAGRVTILNSKYLGWLI